MLYKMRCTVNAEKDAGDKGIDNFGKDTESG